jgi:D-aminopeptidase
VFRAVAECTEEAILNALVTAKTTTGHNGRTVYSLADFLGNPPVSGR